MRVVLVLALPEAVSPFAKHRRRPRELPVSADDLVELRTIEKVVIEYIGHFGTQVKRIQKATVEAAARGVVPENSIAVARQHGADADVGVVLRDVHGFAAVIPNAGLMLSEPIKGLVGAPKFRIKFRVIGLLAVNRRRSHADFILHKQD